MAFKKIPTEKTNDSNGDFHAWRIGSARTELLIRTEKLLERFIESPDDMLCSELSSLHDCLLSTASRVRTAKQRALQKRLARTQKNKHS